MYLTFVSLNKRSISSSLISLTISINLLQEYAHIPRKQIKITLSPRIFDQPIGHNSITIKRVVIKLRSSRPEDIRPVISVTRIEISFIKRAPLRSSGVSRSKAWRLARQVSLADLL